MHAIAYMQVPVEECMLTSSVFWFCFFFLISFIIKLSIKYFLKTGGIGWWEEIGRKRETKKETDRERERETERERERQRERETETERKRHTETHRDRERDRPRRDMSRSAACSQLFPLFSKAERSTPRTAPRHL